MSSDPMTPIRSAWLDVAVKAESLAMTPVTGSDPLPSAIGFSSETWERVIFRRGLGYQRTSAEVEHTYALAANARYDLLRHVFSVAFVPRDQEGAEKAEKKNIDVRISVLESSFALLVTFEKLDPAEYWGKSPLERALALAKAFLDLPAELLKADALAFQPIAGEPHDAFTSAPAVTLTELDTWHDRIDGVILGGRIALIVYKRHMDYEQFIAPDKWFDDEFRLRVRPYQEIGSL